jgi:hypothetical protein
MTPLLIERKPFIEKGECLKRKEVNYSFVFSKNLNDWRKTKKYKNNNPNK